MSILSHPPALEKQHEEGSIGFLKRKEKDIFEMSMQEVSAGGLSGQWIAHLISCPPTNEDRKLERKVGDNEKCVWMGRIVHDAWKDFVYGCV